MSWTVSFVPGAATITGGAPASLEWLSMSRRGRHALERVARGLEPYPTPAPTRVTLRGRVADDPGAYAGLFGGRQVGPPLPAVRDWMAVEVRSHSASPWNEAHSRMVYSPRHDLLLVSGVATRVPPGLSERLERDAGLARAAEETTGVGARLAT